MFASRIAQRYDRRRKRPASRHWRDVAWSSSISFVRSHLRQRVQTGRPVMQVCPPHPDGVIPWLHYYGAGGCLAAGLFPDGNGGSLAPGHSDAIGGGSVGVAMNGSAPGRVTAARGEPAPPDDRDASVRRERSCDETSPGWTRRGRPGAKVRPGPSGVPHRGDDADQPLTACS